MYTECPECQTAFRLTAQILRQAQGMVRCGGCGNTFNALDNLSEELPAADASDTQTAKRFEEESRELLETLDELSGGEEVRLEDTGSEWRLVDDEVDDEDEDGEEDDRQDSGGYGDGGEIRWSFVAMPQSTGPGAARRARQASTDAGQSDERSPRPAPGNPAGRDTTTLDAQLEPSQSDAALSAQNSDERAQGHADVDSQTEAVPAYNGEGDRQAGDELGRELAERHAEAAPADPGRAGAGHGEAPPQAALDLSHPDGGTDELRFDDNTPLPDDFYEMPPAAQPRRRASDHDPEQRERPTAQAESPQVDLELGDDVDWQDLLAECEAVGDRQPDAALPRAGDAESADAGTPSPAATPDPAAAQERDEVDDEDARTAEREIDEDLLQAAASGGMQGDSRAELPWDEDPSLVETIVMEGDTFRDMRTSADDEEAADDPAADAADTPEEAPATLLTDGEIASKRQALTMSPQQRYAGIAAIAVLGLLLAGQVVHANRESLATLALFENTLAPLYAALGNPVTPAWDIRGWQFAATSGSTDESGSRLTIYSRIANRSDSSLPYPLVHVSLTDRFDEVIGSRLLGPDEYLAGNASVARPVAAGDDFTAVVTVDAPSPDATGFKLNVCYRVAGARVRCAIEDFRN